MKNTVTSENAANGSGNQSSCAVLHPVEAGGGVLRGVKPTYAEKLKSPLWQERRLQVFETAKWTCEECKRDKYNVPQFQVHHVYYMTGREPWEYPPALLMCLCDECHVKRADVERDVFLHVATILRYMSVEEIKRQPIWTMFTPGDVQAPGGLE